MMNNSIQFQGVVIQKPNKLTALKNTLFTESARRFRKMAEKNIAEGNFGIEQGAFKDARKTKYISLTGNEKKEYLEFLKTVDSTQGRYKVNRIKRQKMDEIIQNSQNVTVVDITV